MRAFSVTNHCITGKFFVVALLLLFFIVATCPHYSHAAPALSTSAIDECEPNNNYSQANTISMNQVVYGAASADFDFFYKDEADEDFYKVVLPKSGAVAIRFVNGKYEMSTYNADALYVHVYNQYHEEVASYKVSTRTTRPDTRVFTLSKGINYIQVYASRYNEQNHPYRFKLSYSIPTTSITKFASGKKSFAVRWAKKADAYKYQVRYCSKSNMSGAKVVNVSSRHSNKCFRNVKAKNKYFVQVRVAKKIGGKVYWSSWSTKKAVRTK